MLKPQDIVVATRLLIAGERRERCNYPLLSQWTGLSGSEAHAAVKRAAQVGLLSKLPGSADQAFFSWQPSVPAIEEFVLHGLKYVFPLIFGSVQRGVPTGTSVQGMNEGEQSVVEGEAWVWPDAEGAVRGMSVRPLYRSVPQAALKDTTFHQAMASLDLVRSSSYRLRRLGQAWLHAHLLRT